MTMKSTCRVFNALACTALVMLAVSACSGTEPRVGGAPDSFVSNCVNASARQLKVPVSDIQVVGTGMQATEAWTVDLKVGPQERPAVCTVGPNGAVLGVIYKKQKQRE